MPEVLTPEIRIQKDCLPHDLNFDENISDDHIIEGLMKLTAESLAEEPDY